MLKLARKIVKLRNSECQTGYKLDLSPKKQSIKTKYKNCIFVKVHLNPLLVLHLM